MRRAEAARWLQGHDRYFIVTHESPDGDTVGSAAALCMGLRQMGKTSWVIEDPDCPQKFKHLLAGLTRKMAGPDDTVISVDVAAPHMLSGGINPEQIALRIDHHGSATPFGRLELVDSKASACGEIIYDLLMLLNIIPDRLMANALYIAVSTDTGCFRYANTTCSSYLVAAACKAVSPDLTEITRQLFDTVTLGRLKLQSWLLEHMLLLKEGTVAICAIPLSLKAQLGLTEADMENISGFPRSIEGVKIAATLREEAEGPIKLSVRAVPGCDAAALCEHFGGGGHKGAAGASISLPLSEAIEAVKAVL